jgi:hypothetical protein
VHIKLDHILRSDFERGLAGLPTRSLCLLKLLVIDTETKLLCHEQCEVDREAICVIESPDIFSIQFFQASFARGGGILIKQLLTTVQGTRKRFFFFVQNFFDLCSFPGQFWIDMTLNASQCFQVA